MKSSFLLFLMVFSLSSFAQNPKITVLPMQSSSVKPWTKLEPNSNQQDFQFAIVTDRTGGHRPGVFMDAVTKLNLLQPEFVMSVGDLIEGYTENTSELNRQWDEFDGFVDQLEMPFFYVPGNHDITNQVMEDLWENRLGDTYYSFIYKDVLFLCLNSEDQQRGAGRGTISDKQFDWIGKTLKENTKVKHTLVFMHQPLWTQEDTKRWNDVEALLKTRSHHVFTGHYHRYTKYERNNGKYFVLATTGGGSNLRGTGFGEFDHVVWVTMKNSEPIIANLLLEGIWDENVLTEETRVEIDKLQNISPLQFELVYEDDVKNNTADFKLQIKNDENVPMKVHLKPGSSFDLAIYSDEDEITVAPNSVESVELRMNLKAGLKMENIRPATFIATISFPEKSKTEVTFPFAYDLKPIHKHVLKKTEKKITVDGKLKEWEELNYSIKSVDSGGEIARFDLKFDSEMLYLGVEVKDENILSYGSGRPWTQDYIGLCLNAEIDKKSAMSKGENWYDNEMYFLMTPELGKNKSQTWQENKLPEGSKYSCIAGNGGYDFEWAIPISYLEEKQGKDWQSLRFNLMIGDKDKETEDPKMNFWEVNWRGEDNYIGSGMFFKQ